MASPYDPANWYWVVAGSATHVFSSASYSYVAISDGTYVAWLAADGGNVPTVIATEAQLFEVLELAEIPNAIERAVSTSSFDPTDGGPWTIVVQASKFFPIGGTLLCHPTEDRSIAVIGEVKAYSGTSLTISLRATNATVSTSHTGWTIALLDSPPKKLPLLSIVGLTFAGTGSADNEVIIQPGSVMDSTGQYALEITSALTKLANADFAAGDGNGGVVRVQITGTVSSSGANVTGTGTLFTTELVTTPPLTDFLNQGGSTLYRPISQISTSDNKTSRILTLTDNTNLVLYDTNLAASGDSVYRNGYSGLNVAEFYVVLIRKDTDGTVDACLCTNTPSGEPDLPSGYSVYRVLGKVVFQATGTMSDTSLYQPLYTEQYPFALQREYYVCYAGSTENLPNTKFIQTSTSNVVVNVGATGIQFYRAALTGDVTASQNSNSTTIANDVVSNAKLRDSSALSVIGRSANSTGDPADIAAANDGEVLRRSGTSIGFGTVATAGIADAAVTYAKMQDVSATSRVLGRITSGSGDVEELTGANVATVLGTAIREKLTAGRTYYVRTDGSDSNTGLTNSSGGAFLTLQKAWDTAITLDIAGYSVTISVQSGTYTAGVTMTSPPVGGLVTFSGSSATVSVTSGNCFALTTPTNVTISGFTLSTTTSGQCLYASGAGAKISVGASMTFGACAGAHMYCEVNGEISIIGQNYTVSGSAVYNMFAIIGGIIRASNLTATLSGTPAWSTTGILFDTGATVSIFNVTYSGSATGKRYTGTMNAVLQSYSAGTASTYFPGNSNGTTATGAQQG